MFASDNLICPSRNQQGLCNSPHTDNLPKCKHFQCLGWFPQETILSKEIQIDSGPKTMWSFTSSTKYTDIPPLNIHFYRISSNAFLSPNSWEWKSEWKQHCIKMISLAFGTVSLSNLLYLTTILTKFLWFLLVWVGVQTRCLSLLWKLPYYSLFIEEYLFLPCIQFFKSFLNAQLFGIPY